MRSWLMATGVAVALMGSTASAWAEAVQKIGFVDTDRVYRESKDAQSINKTLEKEFGSQFKHLQKLENQLNLIVNIHQLVVVMSRLIY